MSTASDPRADSGAPEPDSGTSYESHPESDPAEAPGPEVLDTGPEVLDTGKSAPTPDGEPENPPGNTEDGDAGNRSEAKDSAISAESAAEPSAEASSSRRERRDDGGDVNRFHEYASAVYETDLKRASRSAVSVGGTSIYLERLVAGADSRAEIQTLTCDARDLDRLVNLHQKVPQQDWMEGGLHTNHLVALFGQRGSGRHTTGLFLLRQRCPEGSVKILHSEGPGLAQALTECADTLLTRGDGFLVDLGADTLRQATLDALGRHARERGAYIVLIGEPVPADLDELRPYAFTHDKPKLRDVLRAHLDAALGAHAAECPEEGGCSPRRIQAFARRVQSDTGVDRVLDVAQSVRSVVDFAGLLAEHVHTPEDEFDEVFREWRDRLRRLAKRFLQVPDPGTSTAVLDPHRQALRIAYVLFHGHPLSDVFQAAALLSAEVRRLENGEPTPASHVFERDLDRLIPPELGITAAAGGAIHDNPRRARLVDEELMPAVVEVVWHGFGSLRQPLREWLTVLVRDRLERVRVRAAQIAGILLSHDFDSVYRDLIQKWAAQGSAEYRQCAVLALEMAADDPSLAPRVRNQVNSWSRSPKWRLQDSAARAYGTSVGAQDVGHALWSLHELGSRQELSFSASIAFSASLLFLAGDAEPVTEALDGWVHADNDHLHRHAVRVLLVLGRYSAASELRSRPVLAHLAMTDPAREDTLLLLWQRALTGKENSERAWELLRQWLLAADSDNELAGFLERFVPRVCTRQLRSRARFRLSMWARSHPGSACVRHVLRSLGPAAANTRQP
ncbi:ICP22 family protein [Streptomyces spongiae]|uniref:Uncharacterized protein n=1 Tax=Streptomyces spongiae TaxID=565072 RepID=A0A5N8XDL3_9ACTN|nr:hypothetical protein [Streptomyces spongiae]MPY57497.1 hypothetical protein [Streptomyces spongiae]